MQGKSHRILRQTPEPPSNKGMLLIPLFISQGLSGRTLRRLPVLAHARYIGDPIPLIAHSSINNRTAMIGSPNSKLGVNGLHRKTKSRRGEELQRLAIPRSEVEQWLDAMDKVTETLVVERSRIEKLGELGRR